MHQTSDTSWVGTSAETKPTTGNTDIRVGVTFTESDTGDVYYWDGNSWEAATPSDSGGIAASENHIGEVGSPSDVIDVTLTLDTSAYASGDLLADTQTITNAMRVTGGRGILQSLTVLDEDDQGVAFTVYLLSTNRTFGTENAAPSITDAHARDILGFVDVATGDYKDIGGSKIASIKGIGLMLEAASGSRDLYLAAVNSTGTPTYTASGLKLRLGILQD